MNINSNQLKTAIFFERDSIDMANKINHWLEKHNVEVIDIKYSTCVDNYCIYHTCIIIYVENIINN